MGNGSKMCGICRFMKFQGRYGPQNEKKKWQARRNSLKSPTYWRENLVTSLTLGVKDLGFWTFLLSPSTVGSMH